MIDAPSLALFDADPSGGDAYRACRDHLTKKPAREAIERAWQRVWRLCPEGPEEFARQFRQDFHARAWELFLLYVLLDAGVKLHPPVDEGPDICLDLPSGKRCWIEAVVPRPGGGPNGVFQPPPDARRVSLPSDDTNLMLRYLNSLDEKGKKLKTWKDAEIVKPDDAFLIAVSQGAIDTADLYDHDTPAMVRACFGIGNAELHIPICSEAPATVVIPPRDHVTKASGADVPTTFLLDPETEFVSGVLYARHAVWAMEWSASTSLALIHRPNPKNPVVRGEIRAQCELWVEEGRLARRGRCTIFGPLSEEETDAHS